MYYPHLEYMCVIQLCMAVTKTSDTNNLKEGEFSLVHSSEV